MNEIIETLLVLCYCYATVIICQEMQKKHQSSWLVIIIHRWTLYHASFHSNRPAVQMILQGL